MLLDRYFEVDIDEEASLQMITLGGTDNWILIGSGYFRNRCELGKPSYVYYLSDYYPQKVCYSCDDCDEV